MTEAKKPEGAAIDDAAVLANARLHKSYSGRVCPVMSIGGEKFAGNLLTGLGERPQGQQEAEVVACIGPACQFFVITSADGAGRPTGGGCGPALLPSAILQLQHTLASALDAMIPKPADDGKKS